MASKVMKLRLLSDMEERELLLDSVTIRHKADIASAARVLARVAKDRGMRVMMRHDISSQEPMADSEGRDLNSSEFGWTQDGNELWSHASQTFKSQIIRACRAESEPFWVNRDSFRTRWENQFLNEIELEDFEERTLLRAAIVVPLHMPFGQIAVAVFTSRDKSRDDLSVEFAHFGPLLAELTRRFIAGYVSMMRDNPYLPPLNVLSARGVECLKWAAFGKTNNEISLILDCSPATIRYHIKTICEKLDSANRAQAIFRAGQLGYLGSLN